LAWHSGRDMVCCVIAAWIIGTIYKGVRWTARTVVSMVGGSKRRVSEPELPPAPVYEVSASLLVAPERLEAERVPQPA